MINFSNMSMTDRIILSVIFLIFLVILTVAIVFYLKSWSNALRYVKMEAHRASNEDEKRHWKRELKIMYWSLIPGLNVRRIKKIIRFFKKGKKTSK